MSIFRASAVLTLLYSIQVTVAIPFVPRGPLAIRDCIPLLPGPFPFLHPFAGLTPASPTTPVRIEPNSPNALIDDDDTTFEDTDIASVTLYAKRASTRLYELSGYRDIARGQGIAMITSESGIINDISSNINRYPPAVDKAWAGDHVVELNMPLQWLNSQDPKLMQYMTGGDQAVLDTLKQILNAPANLIGVDAIINGMKMLILQKNGPARYTDYPPGTYAALLAYMGAINDNYELTVNRTADVIDYVTCNYGLGGGKGEDWYGWAMGKYVTGVRLVETNAPTATATTLGPTWVTETPSP